MNISGTYTANHDMPILYVYSLGGGIKGRTIKAGEPITAITVMNDVNSQSVATTETLHRIALPYFLEHFTKVN